MYPDDSDSVLESCSLGASETLEQIVQGRVTSNTNLTPTHFNLFIIKSNQIMKHYLDQQQEVKNLAQRTDYS